jgi:hypothetical protein
MTKFVKNGLVYQNQKTLSNKLVLAKSMKPTLFDVQ